MNEVRALSTWPLNDVLGFEKRSIRENIEEAPTSK